MTINFPGPFELRLNYTTQITNVTFGHQARYNVILNPEPSPGTAFADIDIDLRGGGSALLDTYCASWITLIDELYNSTTATFQNWELWKYTPLSFEASFVSAQDIGVNGSSGAALFAAGQSILSFRTLEGGIMKLNFMESIVSAAASDPAPYTPSGLEAIRTFILGTTNGFLGRDTSYPFASIAHYPGQNEVLFKKRFRQFA
jgi:hypothetical protein